MSKYTIGISPCPNDTFIFDALIHNRLPDCPFEFDVVYEDVQTLNKMAQQGELDIVKISFGNLLNVEAEYDLLRSGGALGYGCGPLLLRGVEPEYDSERPVILPGRDTTARVLFHFWLERTGQSCSEEIFIQFDDLYKTLKKNPYEQGVVIHESRFTYQQDMLQLVQDLGEFWESETGLPIPLGGIVVKRGLGWDFKEDLDHWVRESIQYAINYSEESIDFIREKAQIPDDYIIEQHIATYVNGFSLGDSIEADEAIDVFRGILASIQMS